MKVFNLTATLLLATTATFSASSTDLNISDSMRTVVVVETNTSQGSGVLIDSSGIIVTNLHVIENAADISITIHTKERYDDISVIDFDATKDIALLKIKGFDLPAANFGNSNIIKSGQEVYAIGTPLGYEQTVSRGIVSAVRMMEGGFKAIQTDAAISPGSSGGGLFNDSAELIGILTAYRAGGQNLNFAIPINYVRGMMGQPVRYSESEFTRLSLKTPVFGTTPTESSDFTKLANWVSRFSTENEEFDLATISEDSHVLSIGEADIFIKLFDSLLWITMPYEKSENLTKKQLARLLELSSSINYAYLWLDEDNLSVAYEMNVEGSTYEVFRLGVLSVITGGFTLTEDTALGLAKVEYPIENKADVVADRETSGLRYIEPDSLGIEIGFKAFYWKVEPQNSGFLFESKRSNKPSNSVFVEQVEIAHTDELHSIATDYVSSLDDLDDKSIVSRGSRSVQSSPAAWVKYTGSVKGLKTYWYSTLVSFEGRLVTFHTWSFKPEWDLLEENTVEFLSAMRLKPQGR